jgi:hypothetical protein
MASIDGLVALWTLAVFVWLGNVEQIVERCGGCLCTDLVNTRLLTNLDPLDIKGTPCMSPGLVSSVIP